MSQSILHLQNWAHSAGGHPIELWTRQHNDESPLLFIGGVHGDEPEGIQLAIDFLSWLQKNSDKIEHNWLLIPCLNPDGQQKNQRTNQNGVDLNRNFPAKDWSPIAKAPRYNPGPKPGSEPEVQAVVSLITEYRPKLIMHFHSWEPCVVYTGQPGEKIAQALSPGPNYPAREEIGYPTPGSLGQYGWVDLKIPVICLEEQEKSDPRSAWKNFGPGLQNMMSHKIEL